MNHVQETSGGFEKEDPFRHRKDGPESVRDRLRGVPADRQWDYCHEEIAGVMIPMSWRWGRDDWTWARLAPILEEFRGEISSRGDWDELRMFFLKQEFMARVRYSVDVFSWSDFRRAHDLDASTVDLNEWCSETFNEILIPGCVQQQWLCIPNAIPRVSAGASGCHLFLCQRLDGEYVVAMVYVPEGVPGGGRRHSDDPITDKARFINECETLQRCQGPNTIRLHNHGPIRRNQGYYCTMERARQSLEAAITAELEYPKVVRLQWFAEVVAAVSLCHKQQIAHLDLHPGNCLKDYDDKIKLTDFGFARSLCAGSEYQTIPSPADRHVNPLYRDPWAHASINQPLPLGITNDIYALGCILYFLFVGKHPFVGREVSMNDRERVREIKSKSPFPEFPNSLDSRIRRLIEACLDPHTEKRPSLDRIAMQIERWIEDASQSRSLRRGIGPSSPTALRIGWQRYRPVITAGVACTFLSAAAITTGYHIIQTRDARHRSLMSEQGALRDSADRSFRQRVGDLRNDPASELRDALRPLFIEQRNPTNTKRDVLVRWIVFDQTPELSAIPGLVDKLSSDEVMALADRLRTLPSEAQHPIIDELKKGTKEGHIVSNLQSLGLKVQLLGQRVADDPNSVEVFDALLEQDLGELPGWIEVFLPLADQLVPRLQETIRSDEGMISSDRVTKAANVLTLLRSKDCQFLTQECLASSPGAWPVFLMGLREYSSEVRQYLQATLAKSPNTDKEAEVYARTCLIMAALDEPRHLWECLSGRLGEAVRSRSVVNCPSRLLNAKLLVDRLESASDHVEIASMLCALGSYSRLTMSNNVTDASIRRASHLYSTHASAQIHSAARWLLQRWGVDLPVLTRDQIGPNPAKNWFRNVSGAEMVCVSIPTTSGGDKSVESKRGYRLAVASTEVTTSEMNEFFDAHKNEPWKRISKERPGINFSSDSPENSVSWYLSAAYCNWLSQLDGIPESEWCFDPKTFKLRAEPEKKRGYRMATSYEWRCFAAGNIPAFPADHLVPMMYRSFPWGDDYDILSRFSWTAKNAGGATHPVGSLIPNSLGLFDAIGSQEEWTITSCENRDAPDLPSSMARGGNFVNGDPDHFKLSLEVVSPHRSSNMYMGLRVVRTLALADEVPSSKPDTAPIR
jgi:serine/threonine protein kinase/formylglycine-generating enzyme required for sulfatase activity